MAVVFGREKTGLHVDEIKHCHWLVSIPTSEHYGSLNLAQAVQILAYEIHLAMTGDAPGETRRRTGIRSSPNAWSFFSSAWRRPCWPSAF